MCAQDVGLAFDCACETQMGARQGRAVNEDSVCGRVAGGMLPPDSEILAILGVADGMGGGHAGDEASATAMAAFRGCFSGRRYVQWAAQHGIEPDNLKLIAKELVLEINAQVLNEGLRTGRQMGTTLDGLIVRGTEYVLVHVGDSRTYRVRDGAIERLTEDHGIVEELVREGWARRDALKLFGTNVATRMLGMAPAVRVDLNSGNVAAGDYFVICTDGVAQELRDDDVRDAIGHSDTLAGACRSLIQTARRRGSQDDLSVVIAHAVKPGEQTELPAEPHEPPDPQPSPPAPQADAPVHRADAARSSTLPVILAGIACLAVLGLLAMLLRLWVFAPEPPAASPSPGTRTTAAPAPHAATAPGRTQVSP